MTPPPMQRSGTVVDARMSLAMWLRAGRSQRNMSLADVARITKIQVRILEKLEAGTIKTGDGMPADVFVRGFVRSIAKCLGLDEAEALRRYTEAAAQAALDLSPVTATASARAFVESMSELAPQAARTSPPRLLASAPMLAAGSLQDLPRASEIVVDVDVETMVADAAPSESTSIEVIHVAEVVAAPVEAAPVEATLVEAELVAEATDGKKKKSKKATGTGKGRKRKAIATGTPFEPTPVVAQPSEIATATAVDPSESMTMVATERESFEIPAEIPSTETAPNTDAALAFATFVASNPSIDAADDVSTIAAVVSAIDSTEVVPAGETWAPKMPIVVAPTVPWRLAASAQSLARSKSSTARVVPSMVIDDANPDLAEREIEDRAAARSPDLSAVRRSFLPPILMDREDRSARQGGLTLAVIILLIAATLTLSYLMRRPSSSGDGVTQAELIESVDQLA